jgi:predicted nuclease of predicted toxin-antitoxin system
VRFLLDEHLAPTIAEIARGLGADVVSVLEIGRSGLSDEVQLEFAAQHGRCLVSANRDDFVRLTERFYRAQRPHAGVLIVPASMPPQQFSRLARALVAYAERHGDAPTAYLLDFLR